MTGPLSPDGQFSVSGRWGGVPPILNQWTLSGVLRDGTTISRNGWKGSGTFMETKEYYNPPCTGTGTFTFDLCEVLDPGYCGCTYSLSPATASIAASGGTGSASVTVPSGCEWTAVSSAPWITITSTRTGYGSSTVSYMVAANTSTTSRTAALSIGGGYYNVAVTHVTQAGQ